jgi:ribosomal-protein-alanine N-acetyltransferase
MKIRAMRESDIEQVMAIERSVFPMPWTEHIFREFIEINKAYVGYENEVVGYICLLVYIEKLLIANLAVKEAFQRKGMGTKLIRFALEKARQDGLSELTLDVRQSNRVAIQFYEKLGFIKIGRKPDYYEHPTEDSIVMSLNIADWSRE